MFGSTPINHASRSLSREWTGWLSGPFVGEVITLLLGINYKLQSNNTPSTTLFSGEYHMDTIEEWWKWVLLNEYLLHDLSNIDVITLFPTWYPFKKSSTHNDVYFVDSNNQNNRISIAIATDWKSNVETCSSLLDGVRLFDSAHGYCFSKQQTRFLIEYNIPRRVFTRCFSYDFTTHVHGSNQTVNSTTAPVSLSTNQSGVGTGAYNTFQLHRSGSFTKIAETGLLPFQIDNMEFNVNNLMSDPMLSCKHYPGFLDVKVVNSGSSETKDDIQPHADNINTDDGTLKKKCISLSSLKSQASMIKWNIFSILKANITPLHVILVYINNVISEWEENYTQILSTSNDTNPQSLFEQLSDEMLNSITLDTLYIKKTRPSEWIFKYQMYHESLYKSPTSGISNYKYDGFSITIWSYTHGNAASFPLCTDLITLTFKEFITFDKMVNSCLLSDTSLLVLNWSTEVINQLSNTNNTHMVPEGDNATALQDVKDLLGENTPFYNFIIHVIPCYSKYSLFWKFLYSITFLSVIIKKSQLVSKSQTTKLLAKDVISTPFLDLFLNTKIKRESTVNTHESAISPEDREKEGFDYLHARVIVTACHEYLTSFLPLAHFFKDRIEKVLIAGENIRRGGPVDSIKGVSRCWDSLMDKNIAPEMVYILMPYPERSMEWTNTPDIRNLIQNIRFTHKTVDGDNTNAIVSMFQKALPFRSQGRSIGSKTSHCCNEAKAVNGLFYYLIRNSLLGMYCDSTLGFGYNKMASGGQIDGSVYICNEQLPLVFRPSFGTMMCYYEMFFDESNLNLDYRKEKLTEWIQSDSKICALVIREFLVSVVTLQPQYAESQPSINWKNFWQRSIILGNLIRTTVENSIKVLYKTGGIIKREELLPGLEKKYTFIFSSQGGFDAVTAKQPFTDKLCSIFKDYNETVIIDGVVLRGEIPMLEQFLFLLHQKRVDTTDEKSTITSSIAELENTIRIKRMQLKACEFDLSSKTKNAIWSILFGIKRKKAIFSNNAKEQEPLTTEDLKKNGIFNFISEKESKILYMMIDMCGKNVYPKGIPELMSQFSYVGFKTLHFVLESVYILQSIQLVMLDLESTSNIEKAMQKRFDMISGQVLPEKAYHIYYTLCCRRVASFHPSIRNYGNESIIYDPYKRSYVCGKKKLKKSGELLISGLVNKVQLNAAKTEATINFFKNYQKYLNLLEGTNINYNQRPLTDDICELYKINKELFPFQFLTKKAKKKVARTIRRKSQLDCLQNPEVLTLDLKGYRLIEGRPDKKKKAYQHCPKCGHFHKYNDKYWAFNGGEYACSHCWSENTNFVAKCGYCNKYEVKRPDRISSISTISVPFYRGVCTSIKSDSKNGMDNLSGSSTPSSSARIWLSGVDTVNDLRRLEIMHANNQTVDANFYNKYNTIISDNGKFFEEGEDYEHHTNGQHKHTSETNEEGEAEMDGLDYEEDGENELREEESYEAMEIDTYLNSEAMNAMESSDLKPINTLEQEYLPMMDNDTSLPTTNNNNVDGNDDTLLESNHRDTDKAKKSKGRLRYRCKGKTSKRFGIARAVSGVTSTRSSSAKYEEFSPNYAIRESSMVDRCEVERLTERMFKSLRRTGRTFLIDLGIPSSSQVELMIETFYTNTCIDRSKLIFTRINTHLNGAHNESNSHDEKVFMHFFDLIYVLHANTNAEINVKQKNIGLNAYFEEMIKKETTIPIIVSSLCDTHVPNMNGSSYSIEGTTRKRRYTTQAIPFQMKDAYKNANGFQVLFNYGLLYREEYYRAIEKKRMSACTGTGGYYGNNRGARANNFKKGKETERDKTTRKMLDVLLTRTNDTHNKKTKLKENLIQEAETNSRKKNTGNLKTKNATTNKQKTKKKQKPDKHWLSILESKRRQ